MNESFLQAVDRYWFGRGSPTALGLFRIFIGTLAFASLGLLAFDWGTWYTDEGLVPKHIGHIWMYPNIPAGFGTDYGTPRLNVLNSVESPVLSLMFYIALMACALLTAVGLWTRVVTILLAVGLVSLHHRNAAILHGGDTVLRVMVLYLAVSPSGRACSLDRLLRLWRGSEHGPVSVSLWTQRLITFNVAVVYLTTVWAKVPGNLWREGIATWFPARLNEFDRFPTPGFVEELPFVYVTTYGTLLVEFALGTLVFFKPLRGWVLLLGIAMHAWIEWSMNIPLFSFLMIATYICFYDGEEVSDWAHRTGARLKRWRVEIALPEGRRLKRPAFFEAVDPFDLVAYGREGLPWPSTVTTLARSVGAWIFGWAPRVWYRIQSESLEPEPTSKSTGRQERRTVAKE